MLQTNCKDVSFVLLTAFVLKMLNTGSIFDSFLRCRYYSELLRHALPLLYCKIMQNRYTYHAFCFEMFELAHED